MGVGRSAGAAVGFGEDCGKEGRSCSLGTGRQVQELIKTLPPVAQQLIARQAAAEIY
jgi:hypothetical protein